MSMSGRRNYQPRHLGGRNIPIASLGIPAAIESIALAAPDDKPAAKRRWAETLAGPLGRKFTPEAKAYAARVASGEAPVPTLDDVP